MEQEKSVYEEWRTYPPVPEHNVKSKILDTPDKNPNLNDTNLSNGENKRQDR